MGATGSKELEVHMARLPLIKRHDLNTKKGPTQTIEVKSGAKLVIGVPITKGAEMKEIMFKLGSAKLKNESETVRIHVPSLLYVEMPSVPRLCFCCLGFLCA